MSSGNGNGEDEDSTPPAPMPPSIEKAAIQAILNLSTSLNGYAQRLVSLTRGIQRIGFTPIIRREVGAGLRDLQSEIGEAADAVDPQGTTDEPAALPR